MHYSAYNIVGIPLHLHNSHEIICSISSFSSHLKGRRSKYRKGRHKNYGENGNRDLEIGRVGSQREKERVRAGKLTDIQAGRTDGWMDGW